MKTIRLLSLEIENFKGAAHRTIRPEGSDLAIFGKNGTGKTTHYDALCWLLFGKDSHGSMPDTPDFEIKPRGSSGTGVMPTVTGIIDVWRHRVWRARLVRRRSVGIPAGRLWLLRKRFPDADALLDGFVIGGHPLRSIITQIEFD